MKNITCKYLNNGYLPELIFKNLKWDYRKVISLTKNKLFYFDNLFLFTVKSCLRIAQRFIRNLSTNLKVYQRFLKDISASFRVSHGLLDNLGFKVNSTFWHRCKKTKRQKTFRKIWITLNYQHVQAMDISFISNFTSLQINDYLTLRMMFTLGAKKFH